MELAPFLDVIFILLIFFAVSTSFIIRHHGLNLQLPQAFTQSKNKDGLIVSVSQNGELYLNKQRLREDELRLAISKKMDTSPDLKTIIQADKATEYQHVIRAMDLVRQGGCFDVILETERHHDSPSS